MKLVGIQRSTLFSPGRHAENDRLILEATAGVLQRKGCAVRLISEDEVGAAGIDAPAVFSMCQGTRANRLLEEVERQGALVINRPGAAQNCHRARLHGVLQGDWGIFAPTILLSTGETAGPPAGVSTGADGFWIKRGDVHATQPGDVVRVHTLSQFDQVLGDFRRRGILEAVVEPHFTGEVVKFYGVVGTPFFRFYCERDFKLCPIEIGSARPSIERVVRRLGLEIYGGDAILTPDGQVRVIDINDWPSFASFRQEAAEVIGSYVYHRAVKQKERLQTRDSGRQRASRPLVSG